MKSKTSKGAVIAAAIISVMVLVGVGVLLFQGGKDPDISILDDGIVIDSMYGLRVEFSEITDISLIEKSMSDIGVGERTNGYRGFGEALKGNFKSDELGEHLLFVQSKTPPTILIERGSAKDIYISLRGGEATRTLYLEMADAFPAAE